MLGFACICNTLKENGSFRTVTVKTLSKLSEEEKMKRLVSAAVDNLYNTLQILKWCKENNILMYRLSSALIPLATYIDDWRWWENEDIVNMCSKIKEFTAQSGIRISLHPDQFCVLNSNRPEVVQNSIKILEHLNKLSNLVGNKILIIHTGSTVGGKAKAIQRFIDNFKLLTPDIQDKLALENDDKSFGVREVLDICEAIGIPMILDIHHYNCQNEGESLFDLRERIIATWKGKRPKMHLSSGKTAFTDPHHADFITQIDYKTALEFAKDDFDIMLECKQKELALLKLREGENTCST
ncbi:MAG: damage endonuclease UvdE [Clostridia bacterium]|jgi:UV DNA damage endonuclease|nr:damage endonuclease UvdE [Clostridia bacterium]